MMIAVTAITKVVLGWFHYDEKSQQLIGDQVAEYFVKGTLLILFILGGVMMVRDHLAEKRRSKIPPPIPTPPTPPLPLFSNRQRREASRSTHDKRRKG